MTLTRCMVGAGLIVGAGGQMAHTPAAVAGGVALGVGAVPVVLLERLHQRRHQAKVMAIAAVEVALGAPGKTRTKVTFEDRTGTSIRKISVRFPPQIRSHAPAVQAELATAMTHRIGGPVNVRWDHQHCSVVVTRRPTLPAVIDHPAGALRDDKRIPFGVAVGGKVAVWDPDSSAPHALIVGATGAGKTQTMIGITIEACRRGYEVTVIDPKRTSFRGLANWPGIVEVATENDTMAAALDRAYNEMERRYVDLKAGRVHGPVLLVIDELTELLVRLGEQWHGKGDHPAVVQWRSLVRLGREARVHLLCGMQRPDAKLISGEARSNFGLAVGLGHLKPEAQRMIGAEGNVTSDARGRAVVVAGGNEYEAQIYRTPDPAKRLSDADRALLDDLRPSRSEVIAPVIAAGDRTTKPQVSTLAPPVANGPAPVAPETVAKIQAMRARGDSLRTIAAATGVSVATVHKYAQTAATVEPARPALHVVKES